MGPALSRDLEKRGFFSRTRSCCTAMRCSTLKSHGRIVLFLSAVALAAAGEFPAWAYPVPEPGPAPIPPAEAVLRVPDSPVVLTPRDLAAHGPAVPDWHPAEHPAMPDIVGRGREPQVWACAYCHLPSGAGRPENASLAGLTAAYIKQEVAAFKNGDRPGSSLRRRWRLSNHRTTKYFFANASS